MEGFRKIQAVVKTQGVGNGGDGEVRVLKEIARLFHSEIRQIFLRGLAQYRLKRAEQVASADSYIVCDILHGDGIGVV